jgi:mannose-6-phosphate isomerase-like protein (cupin superfamily)
MAAAFAKGMPLLTNGNYTLRAGRRVGPGTVEVHPRDTDIFYVTEGEATIVTGGTPVNPKTAATGEISAEKISGGVPRRLTKGDVLVVPAGVPHWFTKVNGAVLYFLVKVTQ